MGIYLIMMGAQGAGKGVQAAVLAQQYGIPQVSTGDLFRAMRHRTDPLAEEIKAILASGKLVSDDVTCRVVEDRLAQADAANGAILDGFPRTVSQAEWFKDYLAARGESVTAVLSLEIDLYTAFKRAFGRVTDASGESYNVYFNADQIEDWAFEDHPEKAYPPRLVVTLKNGQSVVRRPDDASAHAILVRIDTYIEQTTPLLDYYSRNGLLSSIEADQPIEAVTAQLQTAITRRQMG
ncbi:MAG: adenylate kinase family protein [Phototrophicaceae bacterium]|jgi:adenylate kinase